jgi:signal transduction histidine kinase
LTELTELTTERSTLQKLVEAGVALTSTQSVQQVLQRLVDLARDLVAARYAALGVLSPDRTTLAEFLTSGISPEQRRRLASLPVGHGVLGLLIEDPQPLRLRSLSDHPSAAGMPPHHPHMESFVGVPVMTKGRVFGNLYCTEKVGAEEFSEDDVALLQMLAAQAAAALDNAQLRQERDRFFAAASHELGNAVAGVKLWTQHLLDHTSDAPQPITDGLRKIYKGADNAHKLIDDLLSLARLQEGRLVLAPWPTNPGTIVSEVIEQFRPELEAGGLTIDASAVRRDIMIEADPTRLRQIVVNLVSNAIKFTRRGTAIHVGAQPDTSNGVLCWVRDEGPGIAPEDVERIFMPYEQVSGVARGRGTGLGLPLSRQLARLMKGELWVESEVGKGAAFKLRLPLR